MENPLVENIMKKIDIIDCFILMIFTVLRKTTFYPRTYEKFMKSYVHFAKTEHLASIIFRVFDIGI
jgi:hypothetical protein